MDRLAANTIAPFDAGGHPNADFTHHPPAGMDAYTDPDHHPDADDNLNANPYPVAHLHTAK